MRMVVAYVDREAVEPIREELLVLGFLSMSIVAANGSVPDPTVTGHYRGIGVEQHLRPKFRLECVVGAAQAETVAEAVRKHGGERYFVFTVPVDFASPTDTVKLEAAAESATSA